MLDMRVGPKPVAFARICIGLAAVIIALVGHAFLLRIQGGMLAVPLVDWWPSATELPLDAMLAAGMFAGIGLALGCCTRSCAAIIVGLQLAELLADQQSYNSHRILLTLLCAHLIFAESDAAWSLRARYKGARASVPLWPQVLMIGALSSLYTFAGLSKANDSFLAGDVLRKEMVVGLPDWSYVLLAALTVATEVGLGVALWLRQTRRIAVVVGVMLHVSIVALLGEGIVLAAFALLCVGLYPMVLSRPTIAAARPALEVGL